MAHNQIEHALKSWPNYIFIGTKKTWHQRNGYCLLVFLFKTKSKHVYLKVFSDNHHLSDFECIDLRSPHHEYTSNVFIRIWPHLKSLQDKGYLIDHTIHLPSCACSDTFSELPKYPNQCASCGSRIDLEFIPNLNQRTLNVWSIWEELNNTFYIEWIPQEVLEDIIALTCHK
jgi:hypothetical protein